MELIYRFENYLKETLAIDSKSKILLAVSGGKDSMLMSSLFLQLGYDCVIAHCNFMLRGEASELDEELVLGFAKKHGVPCFVKRFDTTVYAENCGISIQMAARDLRYAWFEELRIREDADWIAIGQHRDDHIETMLLNLTRGTGLQGLQGILPKRGHVIRPLLFLAANEIAEVASNKNIIYRDDQSNFSTKYARNKIRLEIIPKFRELAPNFDEIATENISHFQETYQLLQSFIEPIRSTIFFEENGLIRIDRLLLNKHIDHTALLFELFKPYGFSKQVLEDLQKSWGGESGRLFQSLNFELLLDRNNLWLRPLDVHHEDSFWTLVENSDTFEFGNKHFEQRIDTDVGLKIMNGSAQIDYDKLIFPLVLRFWKEGDYFFPLGMSGRKKLSDFFIQNKVNLYEKKNVPILINGNGDIIWVVNYRLDNRYRITESTKKVFTLVCK